MELNLNEIVGTIQVHKNGKVWMIPRTNDFDILSDYLNCINTLSQFNEQKNLITQLKAIMDLETTELKWNCFEEELGGIDWDENRIWAKDKKYGWASQINYQPNLLLDIETNELYLAYIHNINEKFQIISKVLELLMQNWLQITDLCGSLSPIKVDDFDINIEVEQMAKALNRYTRKS